jgi:hypothetical protein
MLFASGVEEPCLPCSTCAITGRWKEDRPDRIHVIDGDHANGW